MRIKIISLLKYSAAIATFQLIYYVIATVLSTHREGHDACGMELRNEKPAESVNNLEFRQMQASVELQKESIEKNSNLGEDVMRMRRERFERNARREDTNEPPGVRRVAVTLSENERRQANEAISRVGYNYVLSDIVPLDRNLGDVRDPKCHDIKYAADLPTASVIIVFYNEYWSTLLRAVHSVVNRSPPEYLHEVILVDDGSTNDELGVDLQTYISKTWPDGIVHLVRNRQEGAVRARMRGADAASGDVIIFLDAQCEVTQGWLEPLLARIKLDRKVVLTPTVDGINPETLAYDGRSKTRQLKVGTFRWNLGFQWSAPQKNELRRRKSELDPVRSPTFIGCMMAMERRFFYEIGKFDEKMTGWGGEDVELAFRTWMCGGSVEYIPCSRVGHTFKQSHHDRDLSMINLERIAHVWLDDYIDVFDTIMGRHSTSSPNVTERVILREKLGCKSFEWFLENVVPDKFIPNKDVYGWGKMFSYTHDDLLRNDVSCLQLADNRIDVMVYPCQEVKPDVVSNQKWHYDPHTKEIRNVMTRKCMDTSEHKVAVKECDQSISQQWEIEKMLQHPPPFHRVRP